MSAKITEGLNEYVSGLFDANSELYFNEKLNLWLKTISTKDIRLILEECLGVDTKSYQFPASIYQWDCSDPQLSGYGRFDQKLDFGKELCIILELKVNTGTRFGQIKNYLDYIPAAGYKKGFVVVISRNKAEAEKVGLTNLIKDYPNLSFVTWNTFENALKAIIAKNTFESPKLHTQNFLELLEFLTDVNKRSDKLIDILPPRPINVESILNQLQPAAPPKKKDTVLIWRNRIDFWEEVIDRIELQTGYSSFCAFRFDLYEWMIRWALFEKKVFIDIYEDKNYEYYYKNFFEIVYPNRKGCPTVQLSDLYYRLLLIRDNKEYLDLSRHRIFFFKNGVKVYFYAISKNVNSNTVPFLKLYQYGFSDNSAQNT